MGTSDPKRPPWETSPWRSFHEPPVEPPADPPSVGKVIGVVAIAIGMGVLGAYMLDLHSHTCEACGSRWRHLGAFNVGDPSSHTCKSCGTVQWWKDGVPHVFRDVLRTPPPQAIPESFVTRLQEIGKAPGQALASGTALIWPRGGSR